MSEDQLQPQDSLDDRGVDDVLDERFSPPERLSPMTAHGVTVRDQVAGETLDERLAEEEPEVWEGLDEELEADIVDGDVTGEVGTERTGRLTAEDAGDDRFAQDEGIDGAAASAEEAAMHTIDESNPLGE